MVGHNKDFAKLNGIKGESVLIISQLIGGVIAGMGGAFISIAYMNGFNTNMVAGRGFVGLAAEAMGQSEPIVVMISALIFGSSFSLSNHLQGTGISSQLINAIPYVVALTIYSMIKLKK